MNIAMGVTVMMTFLTFHFISYHRDMMAMINPRYREKSASKEAVGAESNYPNVNSDEVSGQVEASATITDSPDEEATTENPRAIGGETSMEEDASYQGHPQRVRQGPKRLTQPTYER